MLTKVEILTGQGDTLEFPLLDGDNGYLVRDIEGLGPVKANIVTSTIAQRDGAQAQAARRDMRNLVVTVGLIPNYVTTTVETLRDDIYAHLMPKSEVLVRFYKDDVLFAQINGQVETVEPNHFSEDPEVSVALLCFDPDFRSTGSFAIAGSTVTTSTEQTINYEGNVATGFDFSLNVTAPINEITLFMRTPSGELTSFEFVAPLLAGDQLNISTAPGRKGVWRVRAGVSTSLLYGYNPQSTWLKLGRGDNFFRAFTTVAGLNYTLSYTPKYGGL